jgi:hypothetical protein
MRLETFTCMYVRTYDLYAYVYIYCKYLHVYIYI